MVTPAAPVQQDRRLTSISLAAEYVHVHPKTIRRWIAEGLVTGYRVGPRLIRVNLNELGWTEQNVSAGAWFKDREAGYSTARAETGGLRSRESGVEALTEVGTGLAEWLHDHEIAAVAADNLQVEDLVSGVDGVFLPLHLLCLRDMGMMFGEYWDFTALAEDCAADGVYEFQLIAPPLRVIGAVGSPVNPIAIK